ncbi:MAG: DUF790 family protein [Planctomycetota bacterium]
MLTNDLLRIRRGRKFVHAEYVDEADPDLLELAKALIDHHRAAIGRKKSFLDDAIKDLLGDGTDFLLHRGLARLLEKRCRFEVESVLPPVDLRRTVFEVSTTRRAVGGGVAGLDRTAVLEEAAGKLEISPEEVEEGLYADLDSEQILRDFRAYSPEKLLQRYNVALAQTVLLRAHQLKVDLPKESPARYRQIFRFLKFYRLMHRLDGSTKSGYRLTIDGPVSLFRYSQRYGLQMALFLPVLLHAESFELEATLEMRGGKRIFQLSAKDGLKTHVPDTGTYIPEELQRFGERFNDKIDGWKCEPQSEIVDLGGQGIFIPDFTFTEEATGKKVWLELFGYWKKSGLEERLALLKEHAPGPVLLGLSDRLRVDEKKLEELPAGVFHYRELPIVKEVAALLPEALERG